MVLPKNTIQNKGLKRRAERKENARTKKALPRSNIDVEQLVAGVFFVLIATTFVIWPAAQWLLG
jgi:uncharacterized membrane protein SirB2